MITTQLLRPESIVVVGASNNVHKPGGAILKNGTKLRVSLTGYRLLKERLGI